MGIRKHDGRGTRLYCIWKNMRTRCYNPRIKQYKDYGGRGIIVCAEWNDFAVFQRWALSTGYADHLSIDRIDLNGNYTPDNCKWSTAKEQSRNKRSNHIVAGKTVAEWSEITGIKYQTLLSRLNSGESFREAIRPTETRRTLREIAAEHDMNLWTLKARLHRGMSLADALEKHVKRRRNKAV